MQFDTPCELAAAEQSGPDGRRNWLIVSRPAAWLIGVVAAVVIGTMMITNVWLAAKVPTLRADVARLDVKLDYLGQATATRIGVGDTALEDKIAALKVEIDKLKHNDQMIADKLLSVEHGRRRPRKQR